MPGPTGDIKWDWSGKTATLSNTPPPMNSDMGQAAAMVAAGLTPEAASDHIRAMSGSQMTESELANMMRGEEMRARTRERPPSRGKQRREWRNQLRNFDQYLDAGGTNALSGFQELVENGAMWVDEKGDVYSAVPFRGRSNMLDVAGRWNDFQNDVRMEMDKLPPDATPEQRQKLFQDMLFEREPRPPHEEYVKINRDYVKVK